MRSHYSRFVLIIMICGVFLSGCGENQNPTENQNATKEKSTRAGDNKPGKIICNTFKINVNQEGDTVSISLDTDLPDYTDLMVSVSRTYNEKGDATLYSIDYYNEKTTVGAWRSARSVNINDDVFRQEMQKKLDLMASLGEAFEVGSVSTNVEVSFVVPVNQDNAAFGRGNENLVGSMVRKTGIRVVEAEEIIPKPLGAKGASQRAQFGYYANLEVGKSYFLSKETPLMPEFEPDDPLKAISKAIKLQAGSAITIIESKMKEGNPWYRVRASSDSGSHIGEGWINSMALIGQELESVDKSPDPYPTND